MLLSDASLIFRDPYQEKLDELNDVEILRAVINSVKQWERKKLLKEKYGKYEMF